MYNIFIQLSFPQVRTTYVCAKCSRQSLVSMADIPVHSTIVASVEMFPITSSGKSLPTLSTSVSRLHGDEHRRQSTRKRNTPQQNETQTSGRPARTARRRQHAHISKCIYTSARGGGRRGAQSSDSRFRKKPWQVGLSLTVTVTMFVVTSVMKT